MNRLPNFAQPDPAGRYTYADCLTWVIEQCYLIGGRLLPAMPAATLPGLAVEGADVFAA